MKITKEKLRDIIKEELGKIQYESTLESEPTPDEMDTRQKKVASATSSGAMLGAEQYVQMLKQVLLTPKIAPVAGCGHGVHRALVVGSCAAALSRVMMAGRVLMASSVHGIAPLP